MTEEHLRKILTFFFFATLDDQKAKALSKKCWNWCLSKKKSQPKISSDEILVLGLSHFWNILKNDTRHGVMNHTQDSGWILKPDFRIELWVSYQKNASDEEIFSILLYKVLQLSPELISKCLGLSKGTINYRTSKGVKKLGQLVLENGGVF
jgi:hypothetical protein